MDQKLTINVLGPLEVLVPDGHVFIRNRRVRTLLAALSLTPGESVPLADLIGAVWPVSPPSTAAHQIRKALSSLRELLPDGWDSIRTTPMGYTILLGPDQSDYLRFRGMVARAHAELPPGHERADALVAALRLWRDVPGRDDLPVDSRFTGEAMNQWRAVLADAGDLLISLGREHEAIQLIERYATVMGSDQTTQGLMRRMRKAAAAAGTGPAREVPRRGASSTGSGLGGAVPGDAAGGHPGRALASGPAASTGTNALPARDPLFSGRAKELGKIISHLAAETAAMSPVVLIHGPVGVGKSALSIEAAYRLLPRYPAGAFYLDAENTTGRPLTEAGAVTQLLLQIAGMWQNLPADPAARIALWRGMAAGQAGLVLVNNYEGDFDVRQVLPNGANCASIITSRAPVLGVSPSLNCQLDAMDEDESRALAEGVLRAGPDGAGTSHVRDILRNSHGMPSVIRGSCDGVRVLAPGTFRGKGIPAARVARGLTPPGGYQLPQKMAAAVRSLDEDSRRFLAMLSMAPAPEYTYDLMIVLAGGVPARADDIIMRLVCESLLMTAGSPAFVMPRALYEYLCGKRAELAPASELAAAANRYREFAEKKLRIVRATGYGHIRDIAQ